uniref:CSON008456 protein n=1 Tax=Culicoides sonorensis TaxID=179676 RepID=A0A336LJS8_CULSO
MSRVKSKAVSEICGDCSATDPSWASINRGILLCSDCCSVHRSLGRHISQVKSLRQGTWTPTILKFVTELNAHGANSVWEHTINETPISSKNFKPKPSPKDPIHPNKVDFITAKHVKLMYVLKPNTQQILKENECGSVELELSKQLHASVRTTNVETSLRLIVQGADVNYYSKEKGSTCLHVAAKFGQSSQVELLIAYGANVAALDAQGNNPIEIAKMHGHSQLSDRLMEAMYEVTDRLSYFLCGKRADHAAGQHLLIPNTNKVELNEQLKIARGKLQLVPNKMFEELVMDLYEEVDRRETEAIWSTSALNPEVGAVPFLPTNPHLSATRNQGRQKLARFSQQEFAGLITDVLEDCKRRQNMANLRPLDTPIRDSTASDDEPLYDAVASDDDYAALAPIPQQALVNKSPIMPITKNPEMDVLKHELQKSMSTIDELKELVVKLSSENTELKAKITSSDCGSNHEENNDNSLNSVTNSYFEDKSTPSSRRPVSMYEARQVPKEESPVPASQSFHHTTSSTQNSPSTSAKLMPLFIDVQKRTDIITRRIQELWKEIQDQMPDFKNQTVFVPCAEKIHLAIMDLNTIFPTVIPLESIKNALIQLNSNSLRIQKVCHDLQNAIISDNKVQLDLFLQEVRNCAYDLAAGNKTLITSFPQ